ncbi:MAG TPA: DinB family protein [Puia sp.]|nr:DinB family protein [Puia sp.]
MAVFNKQSLITELLDRTELIKASTKPFLRLSEEQLNFKPGPGCWSIAEIFEHLNISNNIYIRSILSRITKAPDVKEEEYRSGWLGDWVYEKIMPRADGSVFKIRARKMMQASECVLNGQETLQKFLQQCDMIDDILRHVTTKNLQAIRIPFSYTRLLHLRLGDNLRYLIAHSERHLLQAHRVMTLIPATQA